MMGKAVDILVNVSAYLLINYGGQEMSKYVVIYQDERKDDLELDLLKCHVEHLRDLHS
jgi:hypothetical protein